jgi:hypothetical protein
VIRVTAATVGGWLRRAAGAGCGLSVWAVTAGVDVRIPDQSGCPWWDAPAAVEAATAAITSRFGAAGLLGVVTPVWVAVAASSGRLLASSSARPPASSQQQQCRVAGGSLTLRLPQFYASVQGDDWRRRGLRSSGSEFTIGSIALYHQHDAVHHAYDVDVRQP